MPAKFLSLAVALVAFGMAGCASTSTTTSSDQNDPYEATNRKIFELNQTFDKNIALPVAMFYNDNIPEPARTGVHNVLVNFDLPVTFANDVLQGEPMLAVDTLGRFIVNSTVGVGGLIDVAAKTGIPEHESDFGETLGVYGVGEGPFLVLPLLGPSNPRDAVGYVADIFLNPSTYVTFRSDTYYRLGLTTLKIVDIRARNVDALNELERSSVDLYATERSLYRQHRAAEIRRGKPDLQNLPNF
jgi:phospholipid-binding lipoprotein MlaA